MGSFIRDTLNTAIAVIAIYFFWMCFSVSMTALFGSFDDRLRVLSEPQNPAPLLERLLP